MNRLTARAAERSDLCYIVTILAVVLVVQPTLLSQSLAPTVDTIRVTCFDSAAGIVVPCSEVTP